MDGGGETTASSEGRGLKKGSWTATEDAILTEYVNKHGEGNWNTVIKNSGLLRGGKSCRLRWANHLRPNLKKGSFCCEEERIIIELHAKFGNKWARMASQLPGRTDNEIKNYWNTRMKKRKRTGLPLYPQGIHNQRINNGDDNDEFGFGFNSLQFQNMIQYSNSSNTSSSSSSFSSQPSKRLCLDPFISTNPGLNQIPDSPVNFQMFSLENDNNRLGFSLPFSSMLMGDHEIRPSSFLLGLDNNTVLELPSNQITWTSFTSNTILDNGEPPAGNSGLLDALLEEFQTLSRGGNFKDIRVSSSDLCEDHDKSVKMELENRLRDNQNSSHQSSSETNPNLHKYNEATMVKTEVDDDDDLLISLLNNFPSHTPLPDWYRMKEIQNEASPIGNHQDTTVVEPPKSPLSSDVDPMTSLGSCYWSNMPSIC